MVPNIRTEIIECIKRIRSSNSRVCAREDGYGPYCANIYFQDKVTFETIVSVAINLNGESRSIIVFGPGGEIPNVATGRQGVANGAVITKFSPEMHTQAPPLIEQYMVNFGIGESIATPIQKIEQLLEEAGYKDNESAVADTGVRP